MKLTEYLNAINYTKEDLMKDDLAEKDYVPFVVNRCLSYFPDTIIHANQLNMNGDLDKKMQFDYYLHSLRKRKRFSKWLKNEHDEKFLIIKKYFDYSDEKTKQIIDLIDDESYDEIRKNFVGQENHT
jgi:hypothetical protein|tara:strand:- start:402 stop:782 length:381 start_codon:yes stop_codon:yes gene_type:complete